MKLISGKPAAVAKMSGGPGGTGVHGVVRFYQLPGGVLVEADVTGLPKNGSGFFGFHIHAGSNCEGIGFSRTSGHFNPGNTAHPRHAGDLPPLLSRAGRAYMAVISDRFSVGEILGRTVVVHDSADDFTSQPAGNSGAKIACGVIGLVGKR